MKDIMEPKTSRKTRGTCPQARSAIVRWAPVLATATLAMLMLMPAWAQTTTGTISGTVLDPSGQVVPGAKVAVTNEATGEPRNGTTGATGEFVFPSLLPATYSIRVEASGFQAFESKGNILTPNARLNV